MRRIDIHELPDQTDDELGTGEAYRVERGGRTVGFLVPVKRIDPEESERAFEAFEELVEQTRASGANLERVRAWTTLNESDKSVAAD